MYKKGLVFVLALGMTFNVTACGVGNKEVQTTVQTEVTTAEELTTVTTEKMAMGKVTLEEATMSSEDNTEQYDMSYKEAERLLTHILGMQDEETGDMYSYTYMDVCTFNDMEYYVFHWGRMVDNHMTTISQLFVSTDYTKIYSGIYTGDKNIIYTSKNYLE